MVGRVMPHFIEIRQGDSFTVPFQFKGKDGYINLTNATLKMQVRKRSDNDVVLTKIGNIDDALLGKASLCITPNDTRNLNINEEYITDIQITFGNGEIHTIYPADVSKVASFVVSRNVTE